MTLDAQLNRDTSISYFTFPLSSLPTRVGPNEQGRHASSKLAPFLSSLGAAQAPEILPIRPKRAPGGLQEGLKELKTPKSLQEAFESAL